MSVGAHNGSLWLRASAIILAALAACSSSASSDGPAAASAGPVEFRCETSDDCPGTRRPYCNVSTGACDECLFKTDCPDGWTCRAGTCLEPTPPRGGSGGAALSTECPSVLIPADEIAPVDGGDAAAPCSWALPSLVYDEPLDPDLVNVQIDPHADVAEKLPALDDPSWCASYPNGWYYNGRTDGGPSRLTMCPDACALAYASPDTQVDLLVGCARESVPAPSP